MKLKDEVENIIKMGIFESPISGDLWAIQKPKVKYVCQERICGSLCEQYTDLYYVRSRKLWSCAACANFNIDKALTLTQWLKFDEMRQSEAALLDEVAEETFREYCEE